MKFAALGRTHWLYESVREAVAKGHEAVLVATAPAAREYRRTEADFGRLAGELGCPFFSDGAADRHLEAIRAAGAAAAISVNWPSLLSEEVLQVFPHGILNAHAGDLPRYRGNAAPNWAILAGEDSVVLTIHRMSPKLDEGPVLARRSIPFAELTYIGDVYVALDEAIPQLFGDVLDALAGGTEVPISQDLAARPRCARCRGSRTTRASTGRSRRSTSPASSGRAQSRSRAHTRPSRKRASWSGVPHAEPLPYAHVGVPGQVVRLDRSTGSVAVLTGDGLLVLEEVGTAVGERGRPVEAISSTRQRLGMDVEEAIEHLTRQVAELQRRLDLREQFP